MPATAARRFPRLPRPWEQPGYAARVATDRANLTDFAREVRQAGRSFVGLVGVLNELAMTAGEGQAAVDAREVRRSVGNLLRRLAR